MHFEILKHLYLVLSYRQLNILSGECFIIRVSDNASKHSNHDNPEPNKDFLD